MTNSTSPLAGLAPLDVARLAGWKARQAWLRRRETRSAHAIYSRRAASFSADWTARWGSASALDWLQRPGAGRLPVDIDEAPVWCRATCTAEDLALADATADGTFDLIGSGPRPLGSPPVWRTDLYTGLEWPLEDAHRLRIIRGDGSDIRTVWELSRSYHFIALARAYWSTGRSDYVRTFIDHVDSFIEQNPFGRGPHWASPMDAAIRTTNWALGLVLFAKSPALDAAFVTPVLSNLYATALHVERHREWHPVYRGNHYVANGVGLAYAGALFSDDRHGRRWLHRGARIIADELLRQVHADGVSFEGSIGYHRLATQLFGWGAEVVRRNAPDVWTGQHERRLGAMFDFIEAYTPSSGLAPLIGDNDDGHLHVMDARMLQEPRRHMLGLPPRPTSEAAPQSPSSRLYRDGGFAVLRAGDDHCIVRCGPVGLSGAGSHDHNDQLSFELVIGGKRIVRDSGTYCYTRDLEQRYAFRSTAAHNALQLGGVEQNPIRVDRPWRVLQDRTRTRVLEWSAAEGCVRLVCDHAGYEHLDGSPLVRRDIRQLERGWSIEDSVLPGSAAGEEMVNWRLHLDGRAELIVASGNSASIRVNDVELALSWPDGLVLKLDAAAASDRYGVLVEGRMVRLSGRVVLPATIHVTTR